MTADNLLVTDFNVDTVVRGDYAAFALRVDQRRVNARLLRAQVDLEVTARLKAARDSGGPAKLGREERKELREDLRAKLLRESNPSVDAFTVLLHPRRKIVTVLSLAKRANELVRVHFLDTFEATLAPLTPWQRGLEILDEDARHGGVDLRPAFENLRRTDFTRPAGSADESFAQRVSPEPVFGEPVAFARAGADVGRDEPHPAPSEGKLSEAKLSEQRLSERRIVMTGEQTGEVETGEVKS